MGGVLRFRYRVVHFWYRHNRNYYEWKAQRKANQLVYGKPWKRWAQAFLSMHPRTTKFIIRYGRPIRSRSFAYATMRRTVEWAGRGQAPAIKQKLIDEMHGYLGVKVRK